jgi:Peptidase family M1 domain
MKRLLAMLCLPLPLLAGTAADLARAIRENSFDRSECYRVRDLRLVKEDIKIYLTDGHLIFSKPVAGKRIAAVFTADVEGGDGEVILFPPNRAERSSLAGFINSPNLDEHFRAALFLFTGDDYQALKAQFSKSPANQPAPEVAPLLDEQWTPTLRNLGASYQTRLVLDLIGGPGHPPGLFAAVLSGRRYENFDVVFDPASSEQVSAGQLVTRENRLYFDTWTSFPDRPSRIKPAPRPPEVELAAFRIEAQVDPDLSMTAVTRVKVTPKIEGMRSVTFDISPAMNVSEVTVDGQPAEVLQRESLRLNLSRAGNNLFLVAPSEPLHAGRAYEFVFHHGGRVIYAAGDRVFYVSARGNWYPTHGSEFASFDLKFRYPRDLQMVSAGDILSDRTEGEWRITERRTPAPIRVAGFNLGNYERVHSERAGLVVDVCANRELEKALQPKPQMPPLVGQPVRGRHPDPLAEASLNPQPIDPAGRLQTLASEVTAAMEFMQSKFGPPALPHLTVAPIPGTFGQGFPGLIYLSTLAYLRHLPRTVGASSQSQELFFDDVLQAHEVAHQWWGNRVTSSSYRDYWLMEGLANYSAMLYLEKSRGTRATDLMLDTYRLALLEKSGDKPTIDSAGPIVLGPRLESSLEPRAWRVITYGKGSWIIHMLRRRMGDAKFMAMLAQVIKRYDNSEMSTEDFRQVAAAFLPAKNDDPGLQTFFDQWVYGTGIPAFKFSYTMKGKGTSLRLVGTVTQSEVDPDFTAYVPVEIQVSRTQTITRWVRTGNDPSTFTVALAQAPLKVTFDPHHGVLRR